MGVFVTATALCKWEVLVPHVLLPHVMARSSGVKSWWDECPDVMSGGAYNPTLPTYRLRQTNMANPTPTLDQAVQRVWNSNRDHEETSTSTISEIYG